MNFNQKDTEKLVLAIQVAEKDTSGEIRVHIDQNLPTGSSAIDRAKIVFEQLQMHKTEQRNGVLIYMAIKAKQFAIIGDSGIHAVVGNEFWDSIRIQLTTHFKKGNFVSGIELAILETGKKLKQFFPYQSNDVNELSNEISMGEGFHE